MTTETLFQAGFVAVAIFVLTAVCTGVVLWGRWLIGRSERNLTGDLSKQLIIRQPYPKPCWSVFEFLLMFGLMIALVGTLQYQALQQLPAAPEVTIVEGPPDAAGDEPAVDSEAPPVPVTKTARALPPQTQIQIQFLANVAALLLTLVFLQNVKQASPTRLGLIPTKADIRRGAVATIWILAPVLLINFVVAQLVKYEHAVTDLLAADQGIGTFAFIFFSAAIFTPIFEEFLFRLLLQGGLQRFADADQMMDANPNWSPRTVWPILVTSVVFATMHLGQGAAPIPLFFLSIGLGFLYQATGKLTPVVVVHMLLNAATLILEYCRVNAGFDV